MKSFKYISIVLVALLTLVGCKDKMRELNTNSDLVDDTQVIYMFTGATQNFDWSNVRGTANYMNSLHTVMGYRVYYSLSATSTPYRNTSLDTGNEICPSYVRGVCYNELFDQQKGNRLYSIMNYIDTQISEEDKPKYDDVYAICRGLLAYLQWRVYENYGASVYTEAFKAISEGITQPHYDYIEDMWSVVDAELAAAVKVLAAEPVENYIKLGSSDFFAGWKSSPVVNGGGSDISQTSDDDKQRAAWFRFFNMTRLELAWKLQGVLPSESSKIISECASYASQGGIIESVDDGFYFNYAHDLCCEDDMQEPESRHVVCDSFINFLVANKDPRLPYVARPNGATEMTSISFNMMKEYFADSLAKYPYLDGKHPYVGMTVNPLFKETPMEKAEPTSPNTFITSYTKSFNKLKNPKGSNEFKYEDPNGNGSITFCEQGDTEFSTSILVASQNCNRYWVLCGARHAADHSFGGNGLPGLGSASYYYKYHADGDSNDEGGQVGVATRCRVFTYAKQCFILASLGQNFAGKTPAQWYNEGVQAAFDEIKGEAIRCRIQAWSGGDEYGATSHKYPASLTQATPGGDWTINFPHQISQADIDAYLAAHPYSEENLLDQIYAYGFLDPYFAFINKRITGFPEFVEHDTPEEAQAETHAYLEATVNADGDAYTFPRRGCLPDKNATNVNYAEAKSHLLGMKGFGDWYETDKGIWWEVPYMN